MTDPPQTSRVRATLRALRHRNFQLFFAGQLISLIGTWMQNVAQSWLVYRLTGSSVLLGMVGFASQIPVFLLSPLGGIVADRLQPPPHRDRHPDRLHGCWPSCSPRSRSPARIKVWHIFVLSALLGVVNAFDIPARQSFLVEMVGREDLMNAIALNSSMFNGARIVGPAIAGILVASHRRRLVLLRQRRQLHRGDRRTADDARDAAQAGCKQASAIAAHHRGISLRGQHARPSARLLLLLGLVSLAGMPYSVLMPIFADRILHGGRGGLGILMGASGVGALVGALAAGDAADGARAGPLGGVSAGVLRRQPDRVLLLAAASGSRVALLIPVGFSMMIQMGSSNTLIQTMVPDHLRGRVMAVYSMMFMGMAPIGALLAGVLADRFGAPFTVAIGGVIAIAGSFAFGLRLPALRPEARRLIMAQHMVAGDPADEVTAHGGGDPD